MLSSSDKSASNHCEISKLVKSDGLQEKQQVEVVDLFESASLDENNVNPLPNFSIRDFVFNSRSKDITTNWSFPKKNLLLCMKHEMKDVLQPFQSLDSMRNRPIMVSHAVENPNSKFSRKVSRKLALDIENIKSSESQEDKIEITALPIQSPVKKGRLIVKLRNIPEQKSIEDLPESMSSKVCPVCKSFSFSSNTTLNAHIDQCLSGGPMIKGTKNSKVTKQHRIKPRKTRLMMDIYAAALKCTLEDLDRRNGTNWASNSTPPQDKEVCAEEKKKMCSSTNIEENNNGDGAVYFDSMGKKLRILSKFGDPPNDDFGPGNVDKEDARSKTISSKKKKILGHEHKLSKRPIEVQRRKFTPQEGHMPEDLSPSLEPNDQMKSNGLGMTKHWVGSKRTVLKKKLIPENENQHHPDEITKKKGATRLVSPISTDENPPLRKRKEFQDFHGEKNRVSSNCCVKRLRKDGPSVREQYVDPRNGTENHVSSWSRKKFVKDISTAKNASGSTISYHHLFSSGGKEFTSTEKKSLDRGISFGDKRSSLKSLERKRLDFKKSRLRCPSRSDEEAIASRSSSHGKDNLVAIPGENSAETKKQPISQSSSSNLKIRKKRPLLMDEIICEPTSKIADGEDFMTSGKSLGSAYEEHCPDVVPEMDANEGKGNYSVDVDPIPIPGPPGSFLPSPGRMGSEEPQGNSSLTVQSSGDDHELVDIDSSESPISNVSNSVAARSDPASFINLSVESQGVQRESQFDISEDRIGPVVGNSTPVTLPESTTLGFKIGQPCCHSREDGDLQNGPSYYQDSQLLRPRTMTSLALPAQEKQPGHSFPAWGNIELPSPTIRLMGKNLTVGNKDENLPPSNAINGASTGDSQNEPDLFHHTAPRAPLALDIMKTTMQAHQFGFSSSDGLRLHPVGISASIPVGYGVNPFYGYPTRAGYPLCRGGYSMVHNANILVPRISGVNASWDCTREGSSHLNPLTSSSFRSIGHLRSSPNFPTGFL